jgi:MFS family permease
MLFSRGLTGGLVAEEVVPESPDVVLGFDAAWGFALADQTSPALAGQAGALIDTTLTSARVTELRIHGVSGSDGPTMLEHPQALQVAGDAVAGFYRRWSPDGAGKPSVPWKLEAYSWGGLTEAPLASASWLLLAPFMMYNVAYFMLPPTVPGSEPAVIEEPVPHLRRDRGHLIAHALLRLLAMAATVQFAAAAGAVTMSTVAWQAAGPVHLLLPSWMGWYGAWTAGWRVALALASAGLIIALLWWISVTTASKYEARTSVAQADLTEAWPLTQPGFWRGQVLVGRQRALHVAAAGSSVALIAVLPAGHPAAARWVAIVLAAAVLAAAVVSATLPLADRYTVTTVEGGRPNGEEPDGTPTGGRADHWCMGLLIAALATLVISALVSGWTDRQHGRQPGALPGLPAFLAILLSVQAVLLILLMVTVMVLARRARGADTGTDGQAGRTRRPYLGGNLTTLVAALGFALGGLLTAVIDVGVTRLLGTPEPSGFHFTPAPVDALAVPWPVFAFGAAPVGLLIGAIAAAIVLFLRYLRNSREFAARKGDARSPVADAYAASTAGSTGGHGDGDGDQKAYKNNRRAIARAWAIGLIVDDADVATALAVGGSLILVLAAEIAAAADAGSAGHPSRLYDAWHGAAAVVALIVIAVAGWLVTLLRQTYSDPAKRKTIGALWDVGTFWPRAVHPLAPPCYAERAVPEVVDRIRLLTGHFTKEPTDIAHLKHQAGLPNLERTRGLTVPPGPLLLTGYSQGSVIAPAVIAQLPRQILPEVALLTLACPARRLYGRAFPAYFGPSELTELASLLNAKTPGQQPVPGQAPGRWKNLRRRSDFIGSWIFEEPEQELDGAYLQDHIDQPCQDPVILVQDANPSPPPTHRHSQWWQDPRTNEVGDHLVRLLLSRSRSHEP